MRPTISIIVPIYNEEKSLREMILNLINTMDTTHQSYEIICINDGSKDNSLNELLDIQKSVAITIVNFSRNFGKEAALMAGFKSAKGKASISIDADLQHPTWVILQLINKWETGQLHVVAIRSNRSSESRIKKFFTKLFYSMFNRLSNTSIRNDAGDFRLLDEKIVKEIVNLDERNIFLKGIYNWVGYPQSYVTFKPLSRKNGKSSFNFIKLWQLALDGIFSFSSLPLKAWSYIGLLISFVSGSAAIYLIIKTLILGIDMPGYASIMVAILFMGGIQLLSLGIIGEYISRIYTETKKRPLYIIESIYSNKRAINEKNVHEHIHS